MTRRRVAAIAFLLLAAVIAAALLRGDSDRRPLGHTEVRRDLRYAGPEGPALDVYRQSGSSRLAAVLVVHGGAWRYGDKADVAPIARALARAGFVAVAVGYTLADERRAGFPRQPRELRSAVRFVRRNSRRLGVDPSRIGALGISAGAHLAALIATDSRGRLTAGARLRAVAAWSGPFDLRRPRLRRILGAEIAAFLGCEACPLRAAAASPLPHVSSDDPPTMIVNSRRELVPAGQARRMAGRLRAAGVEAPLWLLPGSLHAPVFAPTALGPTIAFLRGQLR